MREILFRGQAYNVVSNGWGWVYGDLINSNTTCPAIQISDGRICPVKKETIGQYTGKEDKNHVKIFEGDIVNRYRLGITYVYYDPDFGAFGLAGILVDTLECLDAKSTKVLGNIHDNIELLPKYLQMEKKECQQKK